MLLRKESLAEASAARCLKFSARKFFLRRGSSVLESQTESTSPRTTAGLNKPLQPPSRAARLFDPGHCLRARLYPERDRATPGGQAWYRDSIYPDQDTDNLHLEVSRVDAFGPHPVLAVPLKTLVPFHPHRQCQIQVAAQPEGLRGFWPGALLLVGQRPQRVFSLLAMGIEAVYR